MHERSLARFGAVLLLLAFVAGCAMGAPQAAQDPSSGAAAPMAEPGMYPQAPMSEGAFRSESMGGALASMGQTAPMGEPGAPPTTTPTPNPTPGGDAVIQRGPMLIYTASLHLAVLQVAEALKGIEAMTREIGGFLARRDDSSIEIRVPAAKFDDVVKHIETLGDVLHRNVIAEDVTEQYMDVAVRLKNARAVRDRLAQLLEKATRVEDSLRIEKELTRVSTDIEVLEGKLKYLRDRAQYSTITIKLQPKQTERMNAGSVRLPVPWLDQIGLGRLLQL